MTERLYALGRRLTIPGDRTAQRYQIYWVVDTAANFPNDATVVQGDIGLAEDTGIAYAYDGAAWVAQLQSAGNGSALTGLTKGQVGLANADNTSDAAKPVSTAQQTALDAKQSTSAKGAPNGYAGLDGAGLVPVAQLPGLPAAWGAITGVLTAQTDLQNALDAKQVAGSYASGTGSANGTNTGDNATNSQYSGLAASKQDTLVSGTNIKTVNGATVLGSGDLTVSASDPSYTPGSFTISTGTGRLFIKRMQLTTTQRATIAGTARLRLT